MPKNIEDIIPAGRRSIRNIPLPVRKERAKPIEREEEPVVMRRAPAAEHVAERRGGGGRRNLFVAGAVALVAIVFLVLALQDGATLAYSPRVAKLGSS